jgi:chromosome segregation ATPase
MVMEKLFSIGTLLCVVYIGKNAALLSPGKYHSTSTISTASGHHIKLENIMQLLENQTEKIQMLENRVSVLEAERKIRNASRPPSSDDLSACLSSIKQIKQTLAANDEYDKNITKRLNVVVNSLENLKVEVRYTSSLLLDVHSKTKQLNTTLLKVVNDGRSVASEQITSMISVF